VVAPEHPLAAARSAAAPEDTALSDYITASARRSELDRTTSKSKSGVFSGLYAKHPLTGEDLPVWVADYVLAGYGTGAVMAVPAHDERDFDFAKQFDLAIKQVVAPSADAPAEELEEALTTPGVCVNSGEGLDGLPTVEAKSAMIDKLEGAKKGEGKVSFKLRDWVFSRQRYWGEPIPIYFPVQMEAADGDPRNGDPHTIMYDQPIAVEEADLPVELPALDDFKPGDDPSGCLARVLDWRFFQKEEGGEWFARETNTMPQWAGSCWYYLRFADPTNTEAAWAPEIEKSWLPVDLYVGGAEHAVLHLLYARFWHKVLYDLGLVSTLEPFQKLVHQGMILGEDGEKMSKSRGNVVNPDDIVEQYGGDAMRLYEMFMGPLEAVKPWQTEQIAGVVRFQQRVYALANRRVAEKEDGADDAPMSEETVRLMHQTVQKVTSDVDDMAFNTAISAMMVFTNHLTGLKSVPHEPLHKLTLMIAPFAPHLAEEIWSMLGHEETITYEPWPTFDEALCEEDTVTLGVQVNGKARGVIELPKDADEATAKELALANEKVAKFVGDKEIKKFIYVPGRIVNVVVAK
jgi:leucyl-tRNA synthetase